MTIKETDTLRQRLQNSCDLLIKKIGKIQIVQQNYSHTVGEKRQKEERFGGLWRK